MVLTETTLEGQFCLLSIFLRSKNFDNPQQEILNLYVTKSPNLKLQLKVSEQNILGNYGVFKLQCASSFNKTKLKKTAQKFSKLNSFCHKPPTLSQYSRDNPEEHSISLAVVFLYNCFSESILT